jgi:hypothetical protein
MITLKQRGTLVCCGWQVSPRGWSASRVDRLAHGGQVRRWVNAAGKWELTHYPTGPSIEAGSEPDAIYGALAAGDAFARFTLAEGV